MTPDRQHWLIIGGGVLGLSLAEQLLDQGQDVTLYEATEQPGGLARPWRIGSLQWDQFPQLIAPTDLRLQALLKRLGLEEQLRWATVRQGYYARNRFASLDNLWDLVRFPGLGVWDKAKLAWTLCYASLLRDWRSLEFESAEAWLRKMCGDRVFETVWLPQLRAELGPAYRSASAAFVWTTITEQFAPRLRRPATPPRSGYLIGGFQRMLDVWVESLLRRGLKLHCRRQVTRVVHRDREPGGLEVTCAGSSQDAFTPSKESTPPIFDAVICTVPASTAAAFCPQLTDREHTKLDSIQYLGAICVSMVLRRPLGSFYCTHITDREAPVSAVIEMTAVVDRQETDGRSLIYMQRHVPSQDASLSQPAEEITERCITMLQLMYPNFQREDLEATRLARARQVKTVPTLRYSANLPHVVTSVPGLYVLNSAHITGDTLDVNRTIELAEDQFQTTIWPDALQRKASSTKPNSSSYPTNQ